jgi:hypothetical protein
MLGSLLISCNTVSIDSQKSGTLVWQHCAFKIFKIPNQTFIQIYRMKFVRLSWPSIVFLKLEYIIYAVHDYFKHAAGHDIFLLDWRQVLSYDVSFLNIRIVVNSVINLVNKNLPRTALQICMFHFNYNFTIIVPNAFNYVKNVTTWEQCSVEL